MKPAGEHGEIEELFLEVQRMEPMPEIVIEVGVVVERVCCVDQQAIALIRPAWVRCVAVGYQGDLLAGGPDSVGEEVDLNALFVLAAIPCASPVGHALTEPVRNACPAIPAQAWIPAITADDTDYREEAEIAPQPR